MSERAPEDGRSRRAKEKRERRRKELLTAALAVFAEKGFHQTRVSDILERAGVARGTFYLYFDGKDALFRELLDMVLTQIRASVVGVDLDEGAPPLRDQLLVTVRRVLLAFRANRAIGQVVLREAVGLDAEVEAKLDDFYRRLHGWLAESLDNGVVLGFLRPIDTRTAAWIILGSVKELLSRLEDEVDVDALAESLLDHHLQGLQAE
jgi:AcrR family transcriptional regulator